jgi:hypothetical protein
VDPVNDSPPVLINSDVFLSLLDDFYLFKFTVEIFISEGLSASTSISAICILICITSNAFSNRQKTFFHPFQIF